METQAYTKGKYSCGDGDRNWSASAGNQSTPKMACNHKKLGRSMREFFPLSLWREHDPADTLPLTSSLQKYERIIFCFISNPVCGNLSWQLQKLSRHQTINLRSTDNTNQNNTYTHMHTVFKF